MMSYLRSILWKKTNPRTEKTEADINIIYQKIDCLEKEIELLKLSMKETTICIQNITLVMHSLSQEMLTIVSSLTTYPDESDILYTGLVDDDDDNLLN